MKHSDSKNSLSELITDDPTCFICLEIHSDEMPLIDSAMLRSCGCKFSVHAPCWDEWIKKGKSDYDCPICGKRSLHYGITLTPPLVESDLEERQEEEEPYSNYRCSKRACCVIFLFFIPFIIFLFFILFINYKSK